MTVLQPTLYNSLTQTAEPLETTEPGKVSLYVCGPTVYDDAHLGHARCYLTWDFLVRALTAMGYDVTYARNVTDVDDKILNRAIRENKRYNAVAEQFYQSFSEDMARLNVQPPTHEPRATAHIGTMLEATEALVNKGLAYACQDGTVYFRTQQYADYGQLSRRTANDMQAGARVDVDEQKEHPLDFAVWKGVKPDDASGVSWVSPWGKGRPGWHIECSCMIRDVLGEQIDIHAGGADLLFPHHENERAQSEAWLNKKPFVRVWMHNGFVNVSGEKMSKSLGNFATIRSLLNAYSADALRYFVASHHYRMPVDFHDDALTGAENWVQKAHRTWQQVEALLGEIAPEPLKIDPLANDTLQSRFIQCLADDLNTPKALAVLNEGLAELRKAMADDNQLKPLAALVMGLWSVMGFTCAWRDTQPVELPLGDLQQLAQQWLPLLSENTDAEGVLVALINARTQAKKARDWATADSIRNGLSAVGVTLKDRKDGQVDWEYTPASVAISV